MRVRTPYVEIHAFLPLFGRSSPACVPFFAFEAFPSLATAKCLASCNRGRSLGQHHLVYCPGTRPRLRVSPLGAHPVGLPGGAPGRERCKKRATCLESVWVWRQAEGQGVGRQGQREADVAMHAAPVVVFYLLLSRTCFLFGEIVVRFFLQMWRRQRRLCGCARTHRCM